MDKSLKNIKTLTYDDLRKMKKDELLDITKEAIRLANNRQKRLENYLKVNRKVPKPAVMRDFVGANTKNYSKYALEENFETYNKYDFKIDSKKLNTKDELFYLRYKFKRAQDFLRSKTSTISGWKKSIDKFEKTLKNKLGFTDDEKWNRELGFDKLKGSKIKYNRLFKVYQELSKSDKAGWGSLSSEIAFEKILVAMKNNPKFGFARLVNALSNKSTDVYEQRKQKESELNPEDIFSMKG